MQILTPYSKNDNAADDNNTNNNDNDNDVFQGFWLKAAAKDLRYFARSKFSWNLVQER